MGIDWRHLKLDKKDTFGQKNVVSLFGELICSQGK